MSKTAALVNNVNKVYCRGIRSPTSGSELLTSLCVPFFTLLPASRDLDITVGWVGWIHFRSVFFLRKRQTGSSRIWTQVAVSISSDNNLYTMKVDMPVNKDTKSILENRIKYLFDNLTFRDFEVIWDILGIYIYIYIYSQDP